MVLPVISGKECTSKPYVRQVHFSDFKIPTITSTGKITRVWSTVCSQFLRTESKIKQCASKLCNKGERKEFVEKQHNQKNLGKQDSENDFHLPSIFQGNVYKILNEERSLREMVASKPNTEFSEKPFSEKGNVKSEL